MKNYVMMVLFALGVGGMLAMLMTGCYNSPLSTSASGNPEIPVSFLFEFDDCRVYRFEDGGTHRYFVKCSDGSAQTMWNQSCGKNCVEHVSIPTVTR